MSREGRIGSLIHFILPIEPVAKGRPRFGNGRTYTPAKTKRFENELRHMMAGKWHELPLDMPLRLTAKFILKQPKRPKFSRPAVKPDTDNFLKAVMDALNGILWVDDSLIVEYGAGTGKYYAPNGLRPAILLWVEVLEP